MKRLLKSRVKIQADNIPQPLKDLPNWCIHRADKAPLQINGCRAASDDPTTWTTFDKAYHEYLTNKRVFGIGFCFPLDHSLYGMDFDEPNAATEALIAKLETYVETSASGSGYHALCLNGQPLDKQKWETKHGYPCNVEIYSNEARFFTVTRHVVVKKPLADINVQAQKLVGWLESQKIAVAPPTPMDLAKAVIPAGGSKSDVDIAGKSYEECLQWTRNTWKYVPTQDNDDGSSRLIKYCHAAVKRGVKLADVLALLPEFSPNPYWTERFVETRYHQSYAKYGQEWQAPAVLCTAVAKPPHPQIIRHLEDFPVTVQQIVSSLSTTNDILPPILHLGAAYATIGTLIGKRLWCDNKGTTIYPNYWAVGLAPTASNKTGTIKKLQGSMEEVALGSLIPSATASALYDVLGMSIPKKQWQDLSRNDRELKKYQAMQEAKGDLNGRIILTDECTGTIRTLLGSWDSKSPIKDVETFLQITDSGSKLEAQRTGDGFRGMYDLCLSFLGFSQNETWNTELGGEEFMSRGLFGRFVPYTSTYLQLDGISENRTPITQILQELTDAAQTITQRIPCVFGPQVGIGEKDFIGQAMDDLERREVVTEFIGNYPAEWASIRNKIIGHAIKLSMIDAFVNGDYRKSDFEHQAVVDCAPYFADHALVLTAIYAAYFWQRTEISAFGRLEDKVVQFIKREGNVTARDIYRKYHFYNHSQFNDLMDGLVADGIIQRMIQRNPGTKDSVVFGLSPTLSPK